MKIDFEMEQDGIVFRDAIVLSDDHTMTKTQIEAVKKQRFEEWLKIINAPQNEVTE